MIKIKKIIDMWIQPLHKAMADKEKDMKRNIMLLMCLGFISNCFGMESSMDSSSKKIAAGITAMGAVIGGVYCYYMYNTKGKAQKARKQSNAQVTSAVADLTPEEIKQLDGVFQASEQVAASSMSCLSSSSSSLSSSCELACNRSVPEVYQSEVIHDLDPEVKAKLLRYKTWYLKVKSQQSADDQGTNKCGYMSLANALAIQKLMATNKMLLVESIDIEAGKSSVPIKNEEIEVFELFNLAQEHNASNLYIVASGKQFKDEFYVAAAQTKDTQGDVILDSFRNKTAKPGDYLNFLNNTGAHWVLATVVQNKEGEHPTILFMNTINSPLTLENKSFTFLKGLWKYINQ
ncbi:MAG: hypothetical protein P4L31_07005 [Candidatus Babeliales bacterium]|nr:hypothetical protein [Candidatus Babeliales bacterium]